MQIQLPANGWRPRPYQMPAWSALERGTGRLALAWHRRAGKDDLCLHWAAVSSMQRVGTYWHMLPLANQSRKAIWDAVNPNTGRRRIDDAFPEEIREVTRDHEMFIRFKNGSTWQVVGSDGYKGLLGSPPVGVVFSEYAMADPAAWSFLRPILAENGGWALFISTPRGRNHFQRLVNFAEKDPSWFGQVLGVKQTKAIAPEVIDREMRELIAERGAKEAKAIVDQEYHCDFDAAVPGTYFAELIAQAERENRVGVFPYIPNEKVGTAWDLGIGDSTVIWFYQQLANGRVRIINVLEGSGVGLDWYARRLGELPYVYADHIWPHDGDNSEIGTGVTRKATAGKLGIKARVLNRDAVDDGIQAARQLLPLCEFNTEPVPFHDETLDQAKDRMQRALDGMRQYRRQWDEKNQRFSDKPLHDWASNIADAFRYLALGRKSWDDSEPVDVNVFRPSAAAYPVAA